MLHRHVPLRQEVIGCSGSLQLEVRCEAGQVNVVTARTLSRHESRHVRLEKQVSCSSQTYIFIFTLFKSGNGESLKINEEKVEDENNKQRAEDKEDHENILKDKRNLIGNQARNFEIYTVYIFLFGGDTYKYTLT